MKYGVRWPVMNLPSHTDNPLTLGLNMKTYTVIDNETSETMTSEAIIVGYWDRATIAEMIQDSEEIDGEIAPELIDKTCEVVIQCYEHYGDFPDAEEIITEYDYIKNLKG